MLILRNQSLGMRLIPIDEVLDADQELGLREKKKKEVVKKKHEYLGQCL